MPTNEQATPSAGLPSALTSRVGFLLRLVGEEAHLHASAVIATFGIKAQQYGVLLVLDEAGPLSQIDVGRRLFIDRTTMVAFVDDLERQGLVERQQSKHDRRRYELQLTAAARKLLEEIGPMVSAAEDALFAPLSADERASLAATLMRLHENAKAALPLRD